MKHISFVPCPSLGSKTCDNAYLTRLHQVVHFEAQENLIQETGLWHNTFPRLDARHIYYVAHYSPCFPKNNLDSFCVFHYL